MEGGKCIYIQDTFHSYEQGEGEINKWLVCRKLKKEKIILLELKVCKSFKYTELKRKFATRDFHFQLLMP
jgi:hypothetical protein